MQDQLERIKERGIGERIIVQQKPKIEWVFLISHVETDL